MLQTSTIGAKCWIIGIQWLNTFIFFNFWKKNHFPGKQTSRYPDCGAKVFLKNKKSVLDLKSLPCLATRKQASRYPECGSWGLFQFTLCTTLPMTHASVICRMLQRKPPRHPFPQAIKVVAKLREHRRIRDIPSVPLYLSPLLP